MEENKTPFVLDNINNETRVGDKVVFLSVNRDTEFGEKVVMSVALVLDIRVEEGNYEANVAGPYGGWKRGFYKVLDKKYVKGETK
jgi:hypothetical protein